MKSFLFGLMIIVLSVTFTFAQSGRAVHGTIIDSTKQSLPGSAIKLISDKGDSVMTVADIKGNFTFPSVVGNKLTLTITSIGYQALKKHFTLPNNNAPAQLGTIIMKVQSNMLREVTIVGSVPVTLKEDTVQYQASAYKVRENAPAEDLIKKLPGVDVDVNGNITTQGKQVTKVRINGKDFMGGDVQSATKNLPADVIENIQMIDDYGDQANLTGVKTGDPEKIMNITIRKDKNYGYFGQATAGDGEDALPASQGIPNENRYIGSVNAFKFKGDQQIAVLGSINNTNVNTFSFGSPGGGGGGNFGGGGGRGNAGRGGGGNTGSLTTTQNGITNAHSIGANFRDQWGKALSVYGSYSFADNTTLTKANTFTQNTSLGNPSTNSQLSTEKDRITNHRFNWNMEYKPDTINYLKVTPTFSYAGTNTNDFEDVTKNAHGAVTSAYTNSTVGNSYAPNYGLTTLFNHRFKHRQNLSINVNLGSSSSNAFQNPLYNFSPGSPHTAPADQLINTNSHTSSLGANVSYLLPIGKLSYLEFNYAFNRSVTTNNRTTDTLYDPASALFNRDSTLSTRYNYTFTTNRAGINYRFIQKKYNYTLGIAVQPAALAGNAPVTGATTNVSTFNVIPSARFVYNFSRSKAFSLNYNGSSSQPSFTQLQPDTDRSNASYPVVGNPRLKPQFTNNFFIRFNNFSFTTGNVFFINASFQQIQNQVVTNTVTFPRRYAPNPKLANTILTEYKNADGYYNAGGRMTFAKPWDNRKFTLSFNGTVNYTNNIGFLTDVDSIMYNRIMRKNIAKNLAFTPDVRFRVDITDRVDVQFLTNYVINNTDNSVKNQFTNGTSRLRTWNIGLTGKNYFGDWTFSYDYSKATNYGYDPSLKITNPNLLNVYLERRFMKDHRGTIRLAAFDLFNQNTGFSTSTSSSQIVQSHVNRLARYYLATFTLRLQKFAGKVPVQDGPGMRGFRRDGGGPGGGGRHDGPGGMN